MYLAEVVLTCVYPLRRGMMRMYTMSARHGVIWRIKGGGNAETGMKRKAGVTPMRSRSSERKDGGKEGREVDGCLSVMSAVC